MSTNRKTFGACLWFTGLSGSGKTTISNLVYKYIMMNNHPVEQLDGDEVRKHLTKDLGFSKKDRDTNIERVAYVASLLARNDTFALVSFISPYRAARDRAREMINKDSPFIEIYVKADLEDCIKRDVKGLYKKAIAGEIKEFTGISDPYEEPLNPEIVIDTSKMSVNECKSEVLHYLYKNGLA